MSDPDETTADHTQLQAQISALHRALMRRVQDGNACRPITGGDCGKRENGLPCSCSLEVQAEIGDGARDAALDDLARATEALDIERFRAALQEIAYRCDSSLVGGGDRGAQWAADRAAAALGVDDPDKTTAHAPAPPRR